MILGHRSSFHCHVADGDVAPAFRVREKKGGGGELADLGVSLPVSIRRCWLSFVSGGVVRIPSWAFFIICSCSSGHWGE